MISIQTGKMIIPEEERFVGFAGDNLTCTKEFLVPDAADSDSAYILYLRFDDGRVSSAVLSKSADGSDLVLTWNVSAEHLLKPGVILAQIKITDGEETVSHTGCDYFIAAPSAELADDGGELDMISRTEFERRMNEAVAAARATAPYIGEDGYWYVFSPDEGDYVRSWNANVAVDSAISATSVNPVQNKAVKSYVDSVAGSFPTALSAFTNDIGYIPIYAGESAPPSSATTSFYPAPCMWVYDEKAWFVYSRSAVTTPGSPTQYYYLFTAIPEIPTNVSAFTNDAGYLTSHQDVSGKMDKIYAQNDPDRWSSIPVGQLAMIHGELSQKTGTGFAAIAYKSDIPSVPTAVSDLTNDSGFIPVYSGSGAPPSSGTAAFYPAPCIWYYYNDNTDAVRTWLVYSRSEVTVPGSPSQYYYGSVELEASGSIPTKTSDLINDSGFLTSHQDISGKENTSNKVTALSSSSTNAQYPTAKCVYDSLALKAPAAATLAGVGITDAYTKNEMDALLSTHAETVTETITMFDDVAFNTTLAESNNNYRFYVWNTSQGAHLHFDEGKTYHLKITCTNVDLSSTNSIRVVHYPHKGSSDLEIIESFGSVSSGDVIEYDYTVPEDADGLFLRFNAHAGTQNVSLKVTTTQETTIVINNSDPIPSYCLEEIERVKKAVLDTAGYGDVVFGLFTDLHFTDNDSASAASQKWNAVKSMRKLADETILDFVMQGGDLLTEGLYANDTYKLNKTQYLFSGCRAPLLTSKGDHDSNQTDTKMTKSDFAKRTAPYMPKAVRCSGYPNNYYFDLPEKKTRIINIDTGTVMAGQGGSGADYKTWGNETLFNWLLDEVLTDDVKTGWRFIVFTHAPCDYEWQFGMAKRYRAAHPSDPTGSQNYAKGNMVILNDLFTAINSAGSFSTDKVVSSYTLAYDNDGVLTSATKTNDALSGNVYGISGIYQEQATSTQFIKTKSFSGWTSKMRLIVSGHCHCDRLNKSTLVHSGDNFARGITTYAIGYTGAAAHNGLKNASDYYIPCFGTDGEIASWGHIQSSGRTLGTIGEQLMDVWIVGDSYVKRVRFGAGAGDQLLVTSLTV